MYGLGISFEAKRFAMTPATRGAADVIWSASDLIFLASKKALLLLGQSLTERCSTVDSKPFLCSAVGTLDISPWSIEWMSRKYLTCWSCTSVDVAVRYRN